MNNSKPENRNFRHLSYRERMLTKDKISEKAFHAYCKSNGIKSFKFGIDGSEAYKPYDISPLLRSAPDKIFIPPSGFPALIEIKGGSNNGFFIKCSKLANYLEWNKLISVLAFLYNSSTKMYSFMPISELSAIAESVGKSFDKSMGEVFHIPCNRIEWTNLPIIHEPLYADNYQK